MADVESYSVTAASNTGEFPEGQAPSTLNDGGRQVQADVKIAHNRINGDITAGGTADALTAAFTPVHTAHVAGRVLVITAAYANATTTPTFTLDALAAKTITKNGGQALVAGDIYGAGHELWLKDAGTYYELMNPASNLTALGITSTAAELNILDGVTATAANLNLLAGAANTVIQIVEATPYTTHTTATAVIPADDTIPQNTEGTEYITVSITPKSTSNRLRITFNADTISVSGANEYLTIALFQDTTANAIAVTGTSYTSADLKSHVLVHEMAAGTVSSTTFKIRIGIESAASFHLNGFGSATRTYGGISALRLRVEEFA